ncbi:MAG: hypothetical protein R3250_07840 [Melioribacteraceae bacterium]|nr:hypothetical protein [Melioribacteraceae bacterium]
MNSIIKHIVNVIGLGTLLSYVWEIVKDELIRLAESSDAEWDDKAVKVLDEVIMMIIGSLEKTSNNLK